MNDPLILGAGPAGCAAAITLARGGARPLLLDRDAEPGDALCGGFLSWRTGQALARLGLDPAELGAHRVDRLVLHAGTRRAEVALPGHGYGISRRALDGALRRRAVAAGARFETERIRSVEGSTAIGAGREWRAGTLFLASGKHDVRGVHRSRTSADPALGLRVRLAANETTRRLVGTAIELHLFDGGYAGLVLQEDGSANVCLAVRKSRLVAAGGDPAALIASLGDQHPRFGERLAGLADAHVDTIAAVPYGWIATETQPGLYRLGDQAAVIPSLAGEGMGIALASGVEAGCHWLCEGPAGAASFQSAFAGRAGRAVMASRAIWRLGENAAGANLLTSVAGTVPAAARLVMRASRIAA